MLFTSTSFLFYFLPVALALHRYTLFSDRPDYQRITRITILTLTLVFCAIKSPWGVAVFFLVAGSDFLWATLIERSDKKLQRQIYLYTSVTLTVGTMLLLRKITSLKDTFIPLGLSFYSLEVTAVGTKQRKDNSS